MTQAAALGQRAIAITDRNTLAGIVRAHQAAKEQGSRLIVGCRLDLEDRPSLLCYPTDRAAYGRLCRLLTHGKRRAGKGECRLAYADVVAHGEGQIVIVLPPERLDAGFADYLAEVAPDFGDRAYLGAQHLYRGDDAKRLHRLARLAERSGLPLVAINDVLYHVPERRRLQDVVTCIRERCTIAEAGLRLMAHAERHLKSADGDGAPLPPPSRGGGAHGRDRWALRVQPRRALLRISRRVRGRAARRRSGWSGSRRKGARCALSRGRAGEGRRPSSATSSISSASSTTRPISSPCTTSCTSPARKDILCQGRGSAANSSVCYCLGITAVDPTITDLLFERFISTERNEPPDIDVDFEHERREEVIQYIYRKYGASAPGSPPP